MNSMDDRVQLELYVSTLAMLIAGVYAGYTGVDTRAIPSSIYIEIAERISDELPNWDYSKYSFEDWIRYSLMIAPYQMFSEDEIKELQDNTVYFERMNGNVILVVTWDL